MDKPKRYAQIFPRWLRSKSPLFIALFLCLLYFGLAEIIKLILPYTKYNYVPGFVADLAARQLRPKLTYPLSAWLDTTGAGMILVIPFYIVVGYILLFIHLLLKPWYKHIVGVTALTLLFLRVFPGTLMLFESDEPSLSIGTNTKGSIEHAKRLPYTGDGYTSYSFTGYLFGRTYVHESLRTTLLESFKLLKEENEDWEYIIGEGSINGGGPMAFQNNKENGLCVDILLPLKKDDKPYSKSSILTWWNYGLEADMDGKIEELNVDAVMLAKMLSIISLNALQQGIHIKGIEINTEVKQNLLGKEMASLMRLVSGKKVKKNGKTAPAYLTLNFGIGPKKNDLLQRLFKRKQK